MLRPLDTQCLIFRVGCAVVVAFRGSQPVEFWDWFYNFTVDKLPDEGINKEFSLAKGTGGNEANDTLQGACVLSPFTTSMQAQCPSIKA